MITAVNFDYRGFDTLGEEFILFAAVLGLALILRERRDEEEGPPDDDAVGRQVTGASVAVRLITVTLVGPTVLLAGYIIAHGAITPGGGFQGGVIAATALLFVYLGGEYVALRRVRPLPLVEITKATGAAGFVLIGIAGLICGRRLPRQLPAHGHAGRRVLGRDDPAAQRGRRLRDHRRVRAHPLRVPGPDARAATPARSAQRMSFLPYAVAIWIFLVGLYGVVTSRHLVHLVICLSVVQSSTYVLLLAIGYRTGGAALDLRRHPAEHEGGRPRGQGADA